MSESSSSDLVLVADEPFVRTFRRADGVSWAGRTHTLQVRHPHTRELLTDFSAFLRVSANPAELVLEIPGSVIRTLALREGVWDLLSANDDDPRDVVRMPDRPGRVLIRRGVSTRG